jgi:hypothetical protein
VSSKAAASSAIFCEKDYGKRFEKAVNRLNAKINDKEAKLVLYPSERYDSKTEKFVAEQGVLRPIKHVSAPSLIKLKDISEELNEFMVCVTVSDE